MANEKFSFYVTLDCLLDTRLGTLTRIDPKLAKAAIASGRYYNRLRDDFNLICGVDNAQYEQAYTWRDKETLKNAKTTLVYKLINDATAESYDMYTRGVIPTLPEIVVNYHPYVLTAKERQAFEGVLANMFLSPNVRLVREDLATMPIWELGRQHRQLWFYDFDAVLKPWYKKISEHPGSTGVFHFPVIARGDEALDEEDIDDVLTGLANIQSGFKGYLNISFLPVYDFSFHLHTTTPSSHDDGDERTWFTQE